MRELFTREERQLGRDRMRVKIVTIKGELYSCMFHVHVQY